MLSQVEPPPDSAVKADIDRVRAHILETHAYFDAGAYKDGYPTAKTLLSEAESIGYKPLHAEALLLVGKFDGEIGKYTVAEEHFTEAYFAARAAGHDRIAARAALALVYVIGYVGGRYEMGHSWSRHAAVDLARVKGDARREEISLLMSVGAMADRNGKLDEALASIRRGKQLALELFGEDDPQSAQLLSNETAVLHAQGKLREAYDVGVQSIALFERIFGDKHPALGAVLSNVGLVATDRGMHGEAIAFQQRALASVDLHLGGGSVDAGYAHLNLGVAIHHAGRVEDAIVQYDEALKIVTAELGATHPDVGLVLNSLGVAYEALQRYDEAIVHVQGAIDVMQPESAELPIAVSNLAGL